MCSSFIFLKTKVRTSFVGTSVLLLLVLLFFFTRPMFKFNNLSIKHSVVITTHTLELSKRIPTKWQT